MRFVDGLLGLSRPAALSADRHPGPGMEDRGHLQRHGAGLRAGLCLHARRSRACRAARCWSEKQKEYVEASRAIGDGSFSIALRQILPNIVSPLIVNATVRLGYVILIVAALSFLGLGTPPPTPDWGSDLSAARDYMETAPADRRLPGTRHLLHRAGLQPVRRRPARHPRSATGGALRWPRQSSSSTISPCAFTCRRGDLTAVDGVSFSIERGQTFGLVGESGSGKSVTAKAIMRLIPDPPGEIPRGRVLFEGSNILDKSDAEMRALRGRRIAMVFQEPMSALNPVFTVCDADLRCAAHQPRPLQGRGARARRSSCCRWSASPRRRSGSTATCTNSPAACASASCWRWRCAAIRAS